MKAGSTFAALARRRGDYEDWIARGLGLGPERVRVVHAVPGDPLPDPDAVAGVVITGSSAMVSHREPWSERCAEWLRGAAQRDTPLLGICYGHQLLAHGLGGEVAPNPRGREIGSVRVRLAPGAERDPLLAGAGAELLVHTTHLESVLAPPPGARRLGESDADPHQVLAFGARAWGVQFHPEFDAEVMRAYLEERRELLRGEGRDPEALLAGVSDSEDGRALLRRFASLLATWGRFGNGTTTARRGAG